MKRSFLFHPGTAAALRRPIVLAALALACAAPAAAAPKAKHEGAAPDTTRPVTFLREMIVTGTRFPRKFYESPQSLSFVTANQLREQPPAVIGDLLAKLPGVDMSKDSPWEQRPVLRGVSGQRVLVLMDGIPMNSARGNGPHPSLVDPSQIERVEVVRGPSSVSYGSDALGGAINIITRGVRPADGSPKMTLKGSIALSGATGENQYGGSVTLEPRIGNLGMVVSGGARQADNFESPDGKIPNSGFKDGQGLFRARYDFTNRVALDAGWQVYRGKDIGIPGLSSPTYQWPDGWTDVFQFKNYDRDLAHVALEHKYENSWLASSQVRFYYQTEKRNFFDSENQQWYYFTAPPDSAQSRLSTNDRYFDLKTYGLQIQATSKRTKQYLYTMGLDLARDVTAGDYYTHATITYPHSVGPTTVDVSQSVPNGNFDNYGAYFENEWFLHPQWTLSTGVRWTQYSYRTTGGIWTPSDPNASLKLDNGAGSGSIGVLYSPTTDLHLTANVASGYRQPNAQDLFYNGFGSVGLVEGNPDLKPEKSVSYDVGMRYENKVEAVSGNLFWSDFTDLIDAANLPNPYTDPYFLTYKYENVSKARIWGGEAEGEWLFLRNWSAHATAAGAVGDIIGRDAIAKLYLLPVSAAPDKTPLDGVAPFKGSFGIRWKDNDGRFWVEPSARYSWRTNRLPLVVGNVEQPGTFKKEWFVVDLMAGVKIDYVHRITVGVRNLGDRRYREALASLPSPGRAFVASFSASF